MFKVIGAVVVYGFALYGLAKCLDGLALETDMTTRNGRHPETGHQKPGEDAPAHA